MQQYRKEWNDRQGCWKDKPRHDIHSEAADAFRQFAQGYKFRQLIHMYYGKQYTLQQVADCLLINYRHYGLKTIKRAKEVALRHLAMVLMLDGISKSLKPP